MPHSGWPLPYQDRDGRTFADKLLHAIREALKQSGVCPECQMQIGAGQSHGISQIMPSEDCRLGKLLREADEAGLR